MKKYKVAKKFSAKEILEYVCWIADADRLYEFSLGTYNLDLVFLVAQQTQKDPKEYLPYLESLKSMKDQIEMKAKINLDLKRYERAVLELSKGNSDQIERAFSLITQHNLYHYALKLFPSNSNVSIRIKEALADYLMGRKEYKQAALIFESINKLEKALNSYKQSLSSRSVWNVLEKMNLNSEEKTHKVQECVDHFNDKHLHSQAAELLLLHYKDEKIKEAAHLFAKAGDWEALANLSVKSGEITEKIILPALKLEADIKINGLIDRTKDFQLKLIRLQSVQENKRLMPVLMGEGGIIIDSDASSDFSEVSSGSKKSSLSKKSGSSASSTSSKKSKTPKNLLKRKMKEGSVLEEEWLVGCLIQLKIDEKFRSEHENFVQYLLFFGLYEPAEKIVDLLEKFIQISSLNIKSIKQQDFEKDHPELSELYPDNPEFKEPLKNFEGIEKFKYIKLGKQNY